jgi:hypothetical protein
MLRPVIGQTDFAGSIWFRSVEQNDVHELTGCLVFFVPPCSGQACFSLCCGWAGWDS